MKAITYSIYCLGDSLVHFHILHSKEPVYPVR
jgi:hypothetical protein